MDKSNCIYAYDVYIGTNDKNSYLENISSQELQEKLIDIFEEYKISFSITKQIGGYLYTGKKYVMENSLKITFITNADEKDLYISLNKIKKMFNQEKALVIKKEIDVKYVKEDNYDI